MLIFILLRRFFFAFTKSLRCFKEKEESKKSDEMHFNLPLSLPLPLFLVRWAVYDVSSICCLFSFYCTIKTPSNASLQQIKRREWRKQTLLLVWVREREKKIYSPPPFFLSSSSSRHPLSLSPSHSSPSPSHCLHERAEWWKKAKHAYAHTHRLTEKAAAGPVPFVWNRGGGEGSSRILKLAPYCTKTYSHTHTLSLCDVCRSLPLSHLLAKRISYCVTTSQCVTEKSEIEIVHRHSPLHPLT